MHADTILFSWILTVQAIGALVSAVLLSALLRRIRPVFSILGTTLLDSIALLGIATFPRVAVVLSLVGLSGVFAIGFSITVQTVLQREVEDSYRGRAFGAFSMVGSVGALIGMSGASILGDQMGVVMLLNLASGLSLVTSLIAWVMLRGVTMPTDELS